MGVARDFSRHLHRETTMYAAWLPVTNTFAVGDFGLISDGVFQRMGNIREFGVDPGAGRESGSISLDFKSDGTRLVSLVGGAEVDALPDSPIEASLRIEFRRGDSYYAKAAKASVTEMPNVREIAARLARANGWRRRYRVVWSTLAGEHCVIITSSAADASAELSGRADALKQVGVATIDAGVKVSSEKDVGLSIVGQSGVVGLRLFKLKPWGDSARLLGPDDEQAAEYETDGTDELEDDV